MKLLIVEDEPRLRDLWSRELGRADAAVRAAPDAFAALELMRAEAADVVLLDLKLPRMDGLAFLERFRETWPDTPVVIITAHGELESAQAAIRLGAADYLRKPCMLGDIEAALARAFARSRRTRPLPSLADTADALEEPKPAPVEPIADLERRAILETLRRLGGNRSAAARALGISRRTLYNRLHEYGEGGA